MSQPLSIIPQKPSQYRADKSVAIKRVLETCAAERVRREIDCLTILKYVRDMVLICRFYSTYEYGVSISSGVLLIGVVSSVIIIVFLHFSFSHTIDIGSKLE